MASLSKFFAERLRFRTCNDLLHPHSCRRAAFINIWRFAWSNTRHYLPIVLLHLLKHTVGGFTMAVFLEALWYYVQLVFGGMVNASLISISMCLLRNTLGEFRIATFLLVPAAIGGAFIAFVPGRVKRLQQTAIFTQFIESLLMQQNFSRVVQTIAFMCSSAIILHGKQNGIHSGFWFLQPEAIKESSDATCGHAELDCGLYVVRGVRNYFLIGLALDIFKAVMSCTISGHWSLKRMRLESTNFLSIYIGIYRAVQCGLRRYGFGDNSINHLLASFLGGLSYVFYPKLTILSYALLEAWRTIWYSKTPQGQRKRRFGYSDVLFPLALAMLIHTYVFQPHRVGVFAGSVIDGTTANYAVNINKRLWRVEPIEMSRIKSIEYCA